MNSNRIIIAFALTIFFGAKIFAQSGTTSIGGTVFDQQNRIISGATVTLTNAEKGFFRTSVTNENGTFSFPAMQFVFRYSF